MLLHKIIRNGNKLGMLKSLSCGCSIRSKSTKTPDSELPNQEEASVTPPTPRNLPIITSRKLEFLGVHGEDPRQAWVENLDTISEEKLGLVDLHPLIFATYPRIDLIGENIRWQDNYSKIDWTFERSRAEMPGGGRKPWPQKGTGRARAGSIRSPLFIRGGKAHGKRGPETFFYMLPFPIRIKGLISALSVKLAQDDIKIVENLEIPSEDKKYIEDLVEQRKWGPAVLFVDDTDYMPKNISMATADINYINLMPAYGLNVHSMLKHETLVLTLAALERIEERLLFHMNKNNYDDERAFKAPNFYDKGYLY